MTLHPDDAPALNNPEAWRDDQVAVARALHEIDRTSLPCPECGAGVPRAKCAQDLGPGCPGHEAGAPLDRLKKEVRRLVDWPDYAKERAMPKVLRVRPPKEIEREGLVWIAEQGRTVWRTTRSGDPYRVCSLRLPPRGNPPEVVQAVVNLGIATLSFGPEGHFATLHADEIRYAEHYGVRFTVEHPDETT